MRCEIDRAGMQSLLRDRGLANQMDEFARRAANVAKVIAPRRTGAYARAIFHRVATEERTAAAYYGSTDYKAWWVEFGSKHNPAHAVLQRAAHLTNMRVKNVAKRSSARR